MHPAVRGAAPWHQPAVPEPSESGGGRPGNPRAGTAEHRYFQTEDGRHYRIDTVQAVRSWPPALDLALRAVEHDYDNSLQEGTKDDVV